MTALQALLNQYRISSEAEREKGTCFEELILLYFKNESSYKDLNSDVWMYSDCTEDHSLKCAEYHLWLRNRQALYGVTNLVLAPGYEA